MPLNITVHLDYTTGKLAWNRNNGQHAQKYFHCVHGSLVVVGLSMEVMNVLVPVTTGAIEQDGEKGYGWHKQILIKFPTISLLFTHNVDCIWAVRAGTKHAKISIAVSDSTTLNYVFFFWNNFCLQGTGQKGSSYSLLGEVKDVARLRSLWKCRAVLCLTLVGGHNCGNALAPFVFHGAMLRSSAGAWHHFPAGLTFSMWPVQTPGVSAALRRVECKGVQLGCLSKPSPLRYRNQGVEQSSFFFPPCFHMWKCKISFWAIASRQFLPEVVKAVEQTSLLQNIFSSGGEATCGFFTDTGHFSWVFSGVFSFTALSFPIDFTRSKLD